MTATKQRGLSWTGVLSESRGNRPRRTLRNIQQNILFALGLKLAFIVLTLFGLASLWMAMAA